MKYNSISYEELLDMIIRQKSEKLTAKVKEIASNYIGKRFVYSGYTTVYTIREVYLTEDGRMLFKFRTENGHDIYTDSEKVVMIIKIA